MKLVTSVASMQRTSKAWAQAGIHVGFVPTMGFLHDGHLSLVAEARKRVGKDGKVVLSIFVNPTQFGPKEDFSKYPRDLERDLALCRKAKVDAVFAPADGEMYSPAETTPAHSTYVQEQDLSRYMEGVSRPIHFRGVTTVVAKLFNIVLPEVAVFGAKDFQQAVIIQRMVRDLNFPVEIVVAPILRESDGLAMSSRNKYLVGDLRVQALALSQAIRLAEEKVRSSARPLPVGKFKADLKRFIERHPLARVDYIEFFDPETLVPVSRVGRGTHIAMAVFLGKTRLIDNARL